MRQIMSFVVVVLVSACGAARGQTTRGSASAKPADVANPSSGRSLLIELDRESRGLYQELQGGILHVQIPEGVVARNTAARNNWIVNKYSGLNNEMRQRLTDPQAGAANNNGSGSNTTSNGQVTIANGAPSRQQIGDLNNSLNIINNGTQPAPGESNQNLTIIVPAAGQEQQPAAQGGYAAPAPVQANAFSPNNIGLLLDDRGHVLVPQYVDRESIGDQLIHLTGADGLALEAKLVGSDQQTGLTVLQLVHAEPVPAGKSATTHPAVDGHGRTTESTDSACASKPVTLAKTKPADGSLVLLLSPGGGAGRLGVWNGEGRDYGVVVNIDGQVAGIARYGQFLSGAACQLITDQIIRNGSVRRATLGVIITQIEKDDALRRTQPLLGDRPAVRVDEVMSRSAAERGGLKQGDILLSLDGDPATDIPAIAAAIAAKDGRCKLQVLRGDQVIELTVELERK